MSLEDRIDRLTGVIEKLIAQNEGGAPAAGKAAAAATTGKAAAGKKTTKPGFTADQVQASIVSVKTDIGPDTAKAIIAKFTKNKDGKLAQLLTMPETFDAVMAACNEALTPAEDDADDAGDEEDDGL